MVIEIMVISTGPWAHGPKGPRVHGPKGPRAHGPKGQGPVGPRARWPAGQLAGSLAGFDFGGWCLEMSTWWTKDKWPGPIYLCT